jgi:hypothetical protein
MSNTNTGRFLPGQFSNPGSSGISPRAWQSLDRPRIAATGPDEIGLAKNTGNWVFEYDTLYATKIADHYLKRSKEWTYGGTRVLGRF